uniref:Uncharacterized protein n=1 Tax=Eutreptiella gymnastica TaxID=73025 RepID=A0A7S1HV31_9EUGL|mmetsp:Transcript_107944/g.186164  ORF Transcript_107944/g.186164 Transcript_107944/m.186164 type:complete len:811 (+) Transcript_107944:1-2433(+)
MPATRSVKIARSPHMFMADLSPATALAPGRPPPPLPTKAAAAPAPPPRSSVLPVAYGRTLDEPKGPHCGQPSRPSPVPGSPVPADSEQEPQVKDLIHDLFPPQMSIPRVQIVPESPSPAGSPAQSPSRVRPGSEMVDSPHSLRKAATNVQVLSATLKHIDVFIPSNSWHPMYKNSPRSVAASTPKQNRPASVRPCSDPALRAQVFEAPQALDNPAAQSPPTPQPVFPHYHSEQATVIHCGRPLVNAPAPPSASRVVVPMAQNQVSPYRSHPTFRPVLPCSPPATAGWSTPTSFRPATCSLRPKTAGTRLAPARATESLFADRQKGGRRPVTAAPRGQVPLDLEQSMAAAHASLMEQLKTAGVAPEGRLPGAWGKRPERPWTASGSPRSPRAASPRSATRRRLPPKRAPSVPAVPCAETTQDYITRQQSMEETSFALRMADPRFLQLSNRQLYLAACDRLLTAADPEVLQLLDPRAGHRQMEALSLAGRRLPSVRPFLDILRLNTNVRRVFLGDNQLLNDSVILLAGALTGHSGLETLHLSQNASLGLEAGLALQQLAARTPRVMSIALEGTGVPPQLQEDITARCLCNLSAGTLGYTEWEYIEALIPTLVDSEGLDGPPEALPFDAPFVIDRVALALAEYSVQKGAPKEDRQECLQHLLQITHPQGDIDYLLHCMDHYAQLDAEAKGAPTASDAADLFRNMRDLQELLERDTSVDRPDTVPLGQLCAGLPEGTRTTLQRVLDAHCLPPGLPVSLEQFVLLFDRRQLPVQTDCNFGHYAAGRRPKGQPVRASVPRPTAAAPGMASLLHSLH